MTDLIEKGADPNFVREVVGLTPLHWAAYNDDADLCRFLLSKGARQIESAAGSMPADIAGFTGNKGVIKVLMEQAASKIEAFMNTKGPGAGDVDLQKKVKNVVFDELEYLNKLEKSDKTGQFKVPLKKENAKELSTDIKFNEVATMRIFYWAAYYGKSNFVIGYMILLLRWSPFIKSFQKQSILTAAIRGKQTELIRKLANFLFVADSTKKNTVKIFEDWVVENWFGKDSDDNNPLHYAYLSDMPDIRQILRQSKLDDAQLTTAESNKKAPHAQKKPAA